MKKIFKSLGPVSSLLLSIILLSSCIKDKIMHTYSIYTPVYMTKAAVHASIKSNPSQSISRTGKLFLRGKYIFLNEVDKGIHVIDNSSPSNPKNISFINIPGNI